MRTCEHCSVENDDTRIFCGNCGTRLPEPVAAGQAASASRVTSNTNAGLTAPPLAEAVYRRPTQSSQPRLKRESGSTGPLISNLFWMCIVSATLACVIQMVRQPDEIPPAVGGKTSAAHETFSTLKNLVSSPVPIGWTVNTKAINQFLESTIEMQPAEPGLSTLSAKFQRAIVKLHKGNFSFFVDQKFLGADLYFGLNLEPVNSGAGLGVKATGGSIGRLPVHPALLPFFVRLFQPVIAGLVQPLDLLKQAKSVTITPDDATLKWPGTGQANP